MTAVTEIAASLPHCTPGMRIGLLGASMNPAHDGHRHISLMALRRLRLDAVWWLVTPLNPLKQNADLAGLETRLSVAKTVADHPRIKVTGFEAALPAAYSAGTIAYLQRRFPSVRFVWLMGADNLAIFHRWRSWRQIITSIPMAIADRPGWRRRALAAPAATAFRFAMLPESRAGTLPCAAAPAWCFLTIPLVTTSSTAIRMAAAGILKNGFNSLEILQKVRQL